jgi:probable rRNA maturation factor
MRAQAELEITYGNRVVGLLELQDAGDFEIAGDWLFAACGEAIRAAWPELPMLRTEVPWALSIRLAGNAEAQAMNKDFRGKDYATNVLSFPADESLEPPAGVEEWYLGDILICVPVVLREAAEQEKTASDHLRHLVVHGLLHLLGYDHERGAADAAAMEQLETAILATLGVSNPYAEETA